MFLRKKNSKTASHHKNLWSAEGEGAARPPPQKKRHALTVCIDSYESIDYF